MTFSPLISGTVPHNGKYSSRQGRPVLKVVQHHWAGTGGGIERMTGPDQASTTYLVLTDGRILGHVPEEFRPWTSGSFEADGDAITIEVQNISGSVNGNDNHPDAWKVSDAAYNSIIALLADVARRYGWGGISASNYRGHREFGSTACPGGYLWNRMNKTRAAAQALFSGGIQAQATITPIPEEDEMTTEDTQYLKDKAARAEQLLLSFQSVLTDPVTGVIKQAAELTLKGGVGSRYVRSEVKGEDTVYERADDGKLRPINLAEFQLAMQSGETYRLVPKWMIDALPKA
jgi:hypothetical protein